MDYFARQNGVLSAEQVRLSDVAKRFGTPTYVYSRATLQRHVRVLQQGLGQLDHLLCYAVKANGNLAILSLLNELGCGFDAVSQGELTRVLKVGASCSKVIVSGVGKTDAEIAAALRAGVLYICVESREELHAVGRIAQGMQVRAPVAVRVNPDVDAKTHPYISTGLKENKFGVPISQASGIYAEGLSLNLDMIGVSCHIGSQITSVAPFVDAAKRLVALCEQLKNQGVKLQHVGIGGGLGVVYHDETPPDPAAYGAAITEILQPLGLKVVFEPGRVIVGNAGILLTRVVRCKQGADRRFVLVDAGMNDLLRPALYDAYHTIEPVHEATGEPVPVDVVGPVCESADTFARQRLLPPLQAGDLLAIRTAGAYGFTMTSTYNGRPRPAEVLCDGSHSGLIRQRETFADLWHGERWLDGSPVDDSLPS